MNIHFSSTKHDWSTPQWLIDDLSDTFLFVMDTCASPLNTKAPLFYSELDNGLSKNWLRDYIALLQQFAREPRVKTFWMNPPYGREISKWVKKAREESTKGVQVLCLLPARTDTRWVHDNIPSASIVCYMKGRLKFSGQKDTAPFPSMLVFFGRFDDKIYLKLQQYGITWSPSSVAGLLK